jgi:hypothetical protein
MCKPQRAETPQTEMDRVVEEYKASTDEGLVNFVQRILDGCIENPTMKNYWLGWVTDKTTEDIKQITGIDVTGFSHNIKGNYVEHIGIRHGAHGKHDQSMADVNDYGRIKYVLDNYDEAVRGREQNGKLSYSGEFKDSNGNHAPTVVYRKRINGQFYVVEAVPDAGAKKLQVISAYKEKAEITKGRASTEHG